jgi:Zn-dependent protease with chaperone function
MYAFKKVFTLSPFYILSNTSLFVIICSFLGVFLVIIYAIVKKFDDLGKGGYIVANELGGWLLLPEGANKKEKELINVVDEISIASGISSLPIYVIESKHINAFVAGTTYDNAVFGVTRGAIELLTRDELQGVIAHEFSHIFNGDMRLNSYISGCISGIICIFTAGSKPIFPKRPANKQYSEKNIVDIAWVLLSPISLVCSLLMITLGAVGMACACFIQLLINHQREFLADAFAVQFTRHPQGIGNALKKIGEHGYKLASANVGYHNHIFFASWSSPPIDKRILKIDPWWDGKYIPVTKERKEIFKEPAATAPSIKGHKISNTLTVAYMLNHLASIGNINSEQLVHAKKVLDSIPRSIKQSAKNTLEAEFIIYALLLDIDANIRKTQIKLAAHKLFADDMHKQEAMIRRLSLIYDDISFLKRTAYLDVIHICTATLKSISLEQYKNFKELANELIEYDEHISIFEWCIRYIVFYPLDIVFGLRKVPLDIHTHIGAFKKELEILLSTVAYAKCKNNQKAAAIYYKVKEQSGITALRYIPYDDSLQKEFDKSIDEIQNSKPLIRRKVMEMVIMILGDDGEISHKDIIIIHALSEALHLPLSVEV